jgi:hypothetical protein
MTNDRVAKFVSDLQCFCEETTQDLEMYQSFIDDSEGGIRAEAARTVQKIFNIYDMDISFEAAMALLVNAGAFHFLCECFDSPIWAKLKNAKPSELIAIRDYYEGQPGSEDKIRLWKALCGQKE